MNTTKLPPITATHLARADKADRPTSADARPIGPREIKRASAQTVLDRLTRHVSRYATNGENTLQVDAAMEPRIDFSRFAKTVRKSRGLRTRTDTRLTVYASNRMLRSGIEDLPPDVLDIATRGAITPYGMLGRCTLIDGERAPRLVRGYALRLALGSAHEWIILTDASSPALTARRLTLAAAHRYSLFRERVNLRAQRVAVNASILDQLDALARGPRAMESVDALAAASTLGFCVRGAQGMLEAYGLGQFTAVGALARMLADELQDPRMPSYADYIGKAAQYVAMTYSATV